MTNTAKEILQELRDALEQFGTYTFDDKGAQEVMDFYSITSSLRKLPADMVGKILKEVGEGGEDGRAESLRDQIYGEFQEMPDDWFEEVGRISGAEL